jgi:hypothetical protein
MLRGSWKVVQYLKQDPCPRFGIGGGDALGRIVTDAAIAADENHADRCQIGHGGGIVASAARQALRAPAAALDGARDDVGERGIARHARRLMDLFDLNGDAPAAGGGFERDHEFL